MVRWKVFVGGTQRGHEYDSKKTAIKMAEAIVRSNREVFVYQFVSSKLQKIDAKWIDGERVI